VGPDVQCVRHFTRTQDFEAILEVADDSRLQQYFRIHFRPRLEFREAIQIYDCILFPEYIVKAALGQAPVQGHLAAFKARANRAPRAGLLALVPARCRLGVAAAYPPSYALWLAIRAWRRRQTI
jgi:hypothetical protein